jgi:hypothetical protein
MIERQGAQLLHALGTACTGNGVCTGGEMLD